MADNTRHICGIFRGQGFQCPRCVHAPRGSGYGSTSSAIPVAELPETYEYLTRLEVILGKPIARLNASRGFEHWFEVFRGALPSPQMRWCTRKHEDQAD